MANRIAIAAEGGKGRDREARHVTSWQKRRRCGGGGGEGAAVPASAAVTVRRAARRRRAATAAKTPSPALPARGPFAASCIAAAATEAAEAAEAAIPEGVWRPWPPTGAPTLHRDSGGGGVGGSSSSPYQGERAGTGRGER